MDTSQKLSTAALLYNCAQQMGLRPSWITVDGMFAVLANGHEKYINFARSPLNSHVSASLVKDKYLTRLILGRHNITNIPFARPDTQNDAEIFLRMYKKIIAKPVNGSGARDIHIITRQAQLQDLDIANYILEKYVAGREMRYLILNGAVIGVHRSEYGTSVEETRPLQRISYSRSRWNPLLIASSIQIARIFDLKFAAVDYIIDANGIAHILEVNTTPGLKWFHAPTSGPVVDVARQFLEAVFQTEEVVASDNETSLSVFQAAPLN
jgi:glutathione synthase/RimK-type ligase-like ATP-grasp enzyme